MLNGFTLPSMTGFERFWSAYPKRKAKKDAEKAWQQVNGDKHLPEILTALAWQTTQTDWIKSGGQFVPLPATYLRGLRWEDEPSEQPQVSEKTARTLAAVSRWAGR